MIRFRRYTVKFEGKIASGASGPQKLAKIGKNWPGWKFRINWIWEYHDFLEQAFCQMLSTGQEDQEQPMFWFKVQITTTPYQKRIIK